MKVLHICSYYLSSNLFSKLITVLDNMRIQNVVFVPLSDADKVYWDMSCDNNIDVHIERFLSETDRILFKKKSKKVFDYLDHNYDLKEYDLIHAHSLFSNGIIANMVYEKYGIPYVVAIRNTDLNFFFKYLIIYRNDGIRIMKNAKRVVFLSHSYLKRLHEKYIPRKIQETIKMKCMVIPNGIDSFWLDNKLTRFTVPSKKLAIITVGSVEKNKNQLFVAETVRELANQGYDISYLIVGDILDKKYFDRIKDILPELEHIPFKNKEQLIELYRKNDVFVMTSFRESFGLVYAEAMSQGLPVIYTRGEGFDKQFDDGIVGYSVNPYSKEELKKSIILVIDQYLRLSKNCTLLSESFNWSKLARKYKEIYEEV